MLHYVTLQLSARESTLSEVSSLSGREVHVLHCSEHSTHQVLCDYVRGMAATGMCVRMCIMYCTVSTVSM